MKLKVLFVLTLFLAFVACKKDEEKEDVKASEDVNFDSLVFSKQTVTENKAYIENTGVKMVGELKSMNQDAGVKATVNLMQLVTKGGVNGSIQSSVYFKIMRAIESNSKSTDSKVMFSALTDDNQDENLTLSEEFAKIAGEYTYNFGTTKFDFKANPSSNAITFVFPASLESKTNKVLDGKLIITKPKVATGNFTALDSALTELPTELTYKLMVKESTVVSYSFTASYQTDGIPTSVVSQLTIGSFEFKVEYGYNASKLDINYSFKHGSTTILDMGATLGGKFTKADLDKVEETNIEKDSSMWFSYNNETGKLDTTYYVWENRRTELYPERALTNANAHFQFMDVKIAGKIDFTNFMKDIRRAEELDLPVDSAPKIINRNVDLVVVYASNNQVIAKAEAAIENIIRKEEECSIDQATQTWKCVVVDKNDKEISMNMIFADGSKSTMEDYFSNGFNKTIDSFNEFIDELNKTYNWTIDHVETPQGN